MAKNATATESTTENNCDVDKSLAALSDLYKNVTMAQNAIKTLLPYVEGQDLTKMLHKQVESYDEYIEKVGTLSKNRSFEPTPAPQIALSMAGMGIRMKMLADKSDGHAAKIMIQGTLNGLIDLYRLTKELSCVHPEVTLLARQILKYEEVCFENIKSQL